MSGENILKGCLVESDPAVIARERQAKRRALVVAIILQVLLVGLLVLAPLLGAVERLPATVVFRTPVPPYKGGPKGDDPPKPVKPSRERKPLMMNHQSKIFAPPYIPPRVGDVMDPPEAFEAQAGRERGIEGVGDPNGIIELIAPGERSAAVPEPPEMKPQPKPRPEVSEGVQAARLVHRVEPKYPPLPRSAGIEGKVVLRAIIAKDGTIQSLEVLSGHPLFIEAAREAIGQWRFQPTLLSGVPVEVETQITVVFSMRR